MKTLHVLDRRLLSALLAASALLASLLIATPAPARTFEVRTVMSKDGADVYFDPVGLRIEPGDTVRWIQVNRYHSVTAYHPSNGDHELRIPERAQPWDSGILLAEYLSPGSTFEQTFTVPGVYDYLCIPHEAAGMVGRIVVVNLTRGRGPARSAMRPIANGSPCPRLRNRPFRR